MSKRNLMVVGCPAVRHVIRLVEGHPAHEASDAGVRTAVGTAARTNRT
jgi:hypothetical protein